MTLSNSRINVERILDDNGEMIDGTYRVTVAARMSHNGSVRNDMPDVWDDSYDPEEFADNQWGTFSGTTLKCVDIFGVTVHGGVARMVAGGRKCTCYAYGSKL